MGVKPCTFPKRAPFCWVLGMSNLLRGCLCTWGLGLCLVFVLTVRLMGGGAWAEHISFFFFLINLFIYLFLAVLGLLAPWLSLVAASGGYSSLWCTGLLIVVASLVAEHGL